MALQILHIDSSPRGAVSHSRALTKELVDSLVEKNSGASVTYRNVAHNPPPHVSEAWTAGAYLPAEQRTPEQARALRASDELVDEVLAANIIVVGVPMYNFNVPSSFKAWIDQIARFGRTWIAEYKPDGSSVYTGLAIGKKVFVVTSRGGGGYGAGEVMESRNFQDGFLRTVFGFIGITDVEFIHINNTAKGDEAVTESVGNARTQIGAAVAT